MTVHLLLGQEKEISHDVAGKILPEFHCGQFPAIIIGQKLEKAVMLVTKNDTSTNAIKLRIAQENDYVISDIHSSACIYDEHNVLALELMPLYVSQSKANPVKTLDVLAYQMQDCLAETTANNPPVLFLWHGNFYLKLHKNLKVLKVMKEIKQVSLLRSSSNSRPAIS